MENITPNKNYVNQWVEKVHKWYLLYALDSTDDTDTHEVYTSVLKDDDNLESISEKLDRQINSAKILTQKSSSSSEDLSLNLPIIRNKSDNCADKHSLCKKNYFKVDINKQKLLRKQHKCGTENQVQCVTKADYTKCKCKPSSFTLNGLSESIVLKEEYKSDPDVMIVEEHLYFGKNRLKNFENSNRQPVKTSTNLSSNFNSQEVHNEGRENVNVPNKYIFMCLLCANQNCFHLISERNEIEIETPCLKCYAEHKLVFLNRELTTIKLNIFANVVNNYSSKKCNSSIPNMGAEPTKKTQRNNSINSDHLIFKVPNQMLYDTNSKKNNNMEETNSCCNKYHLSHKHCNSKNQNGTSLSQISNIHSVASCCNDRDCNDHHYLKKMEMCCDNLSQKTKSKYLKTNQECNKTLENHNRKCPSYTNFADNSEKNISTADKCLNKQIKRKSPLTSESDQFLLPNIFAFKRKKLKNVVFTDDNTANNSVQHSSNSRRIVENRSIESLNKSELTNSNEKNNVLNKSHKHVSQIEPTTMETKCNSKQSTNISSKEERQCLQINSHNMQPNLMPTEYCNSIQNENNIIDPVKREPNDEENTVNNLNLENTQMCCQYVESSHNTENENTLRISENDKMSKTNDSCKKKPIYKKQDEEDIQNEENRRIETQNISEKSTIDLNLEINSKNIKEKVKLLEKNHHHKANYLSVDENQHLNIKENDKGRQSGQIEELESEISYTKSDVDTIVLILETSSNESASRSSEKSCTKTENISKQNLYRKKLRSSSKKNNDSENHTMFSNNMNTSNKIKSKEANKISRTRFITYKKKKNKQENLKECMDNIGIVNKETPLVTKSSKMYLNQECTNISKKLLNSDQLEENGEIKNDIRNTDEQINLLSSSKYDDENIIRSLNTNINDIVKIEDTELDSFENQTGKQLGTQLSYENSSEIVTDFHQLNNFQNVNLFENDISNEFQQIQILSFSNETDALNNENKINTLNNQNSEKLKTKPDQNVQLSKKELKSDNNIYQNSNLTANCNVLQNQIKQNETSAKYIKIKNIGQLMDVNTFKSYNDQLPVHIHSPLSDENTYFLSCESFNKSYSQLYKIIPTQDVYHSLESVIVKSSKSLILTSDISGIEHFNDIYKYPENILSDRINNKNVRHNEFTNSSQFLNGIELSDYLIEQDLNGLSLTSQLK